MGLPEMVHSYPWMQVCISVHAVHVDCMFQSCQKSWSVAAVALMSSQLDCSQSVQAGSAVIFSTTQIWEKRFYTLMGAGSAHDNVSACQASVRCSALIMLSETLIHVVHM